MTSHDPPRILKIHEYDVESDPASRQKEIRGWNQEKIASSKVLVAGAGALGNELVKDLVLLGFGKIIIIDYDQVAYSNLNRCLFFTRKDAEEKKPKSVSLAEKAKTLDPYGYIEIIPVVDEIGEFGIKYNSKLFTDVDIVFGALDNQAGRVYLSVAAQYNNKPYVDGGMWGPMGNVFVSVPPDSPCYVCSLTESTWANALKRLQCSFKGISDDPRIIPSLPTTASIVAAIQVQEALKILFADVRGVHPLGEPSAGKFLSINLSHNDFFIYSVQRRKDCPVCSYQGGEFDATNKLAAEETR